ncbi:MAG: hemolysin family protein [Actinomycetota bacterium]
MNGLSTQLGLIAVLVLLNGLLAGSEIALISLREDQRQRLGGRGRAGAALVRLTDDPNRFLATIQIGITLTGFLASATAAVTLAEPLVEPLAALGAAARPTAVALVTVALTAITLVFGELAPKRLALEHGEGWALRVAGPLNLLATLTRPAVWALGVATNGIVRLLGGDPQRGAQEVSTEELREMVARQPELTPTEREIIHAAFGFADRPLRTLLRPRNEVVALPADLPADAAARVLGDAGYSRAPVRGDDLDDVLGTVHLRALIDAEGLVGAHATEAVFLPESLGALDALRALQRQRQHLAIVVAEHGGTEGIVTVEDLLEELVGEIWDEGETAQPGAEPQEDGTYAVLGTTPVHDLAALGIVLPEGPYSTVAGLVLERLGRLAEPGDEIVMAGWRLTVESVQGNAIECLRLAPEPDDTAS